MTTENLVWALREVMQADIRYAEASQNAAEAFQTALDAAIDARIKIALAKQGADMKTNELTGAALDWAVLTIEQNEGAAWYIDHKSRLMEEHGDLAWAYQPSTDWAQGGPIIERGYIELHTYSENDDGIVTWRANDFMDGPTPLIAAMRCYVACTLGDNINIPEELC